MSARRSRPSPSHTLSTLTDTGRRQSQSLLAQERIQAEWEAKSAPIAVAYCRCPHVDHWLLKRAWIGKRRCDRCRATFAAEPCPARPAQPPVVLLVFTEEGK